MMVVLVQQMRYCVLWKCLKVLVRVSLQFNLFKKIQDHSERYKDDLPEIEVKKRKARIHKVKKGKSNKVPRKRKMPFKTNTV